jgi:hypothetical protein
MLLKDLRRFRDGKPLQTKVYKILQALLKEDQLMTDQVGGRGKV